MIATICILVKNAGLYLVDLLNALDQQVLGEEFEALFIDSGSTDQSLSIFSDRNARVIQIRPEDFNHGTTRNLAAHNANPGSRFLFYLTQDALPSNEYWLANLLAPLESDDRVAGAFSRHIPRPGASPSLIRQLTTRWQTGGVERIVKEMPDNAEEYANRMDWYIYFSNTSSAIRRSIWEQIPFRALDFAEDADWADRVLRAGYKIVFESSSAVIHSHDYGTIEQFR